MKFETFTERIFAVPGFRLCQQNAGTRFTGDPMKRIVALLMLCFILPRLIGCEAKGKVDADHDEVKAKVKVDKD